MKDVAKNVVADGRTRYDRWHLARADARDAGSVPSLVVETAREWTAAEHRTGGEDVTILSVSRGGERPGGVAFGLLVHEVLARAPFGATRGALDDLAAVEARVLGLTAEEAAAAAEVVEQVLTHELLRRAHDAELRGACRRETPITWMSPDGTLIEGIVDLAFEDAGRWTVVDYKTDRELAAAGEDHYRRQVALYAAAIAQATGQPSRGVLIRV